MFYIIVNPFVKRYAALSVLLPAVDVITAERPYLCHREGFVLTRIPVAPSVTGKDGYFPPPT